MDGNIELNVEQKVLKMEHCGLNDGTIDIMGYYMSDLYQMEKTDKVEEYLAKMKFGEVNEGEKVVVTRELSDEDIIEVLKRDGEKINIAVKRQDMGEKGMGRKLANLLIGYIENKSDFSNYKNVSLCIVY
jgi:hypothetical protein